MYKRRKQKSYTRNYRGAHAGEYNILINNAHLNDNQKLLHIFGLRIMTCWKIPYAQYFKCLLFFGY